MVQLAVVLDVAALAVVLKYGGCHHNSFRKVNGPQWRMRPLWEKRRSQAWLAHAAA
jgi:hypothetical protein